MDADGAPASDSRFSFSRLAFRGADYRRTATSLLLVMDSAEEMNSWLGVVRREIEALGGKKHVSETGKPKPDEKITQLKAQPSHRYLVQREPEQAPKASSPASLTFCASREEDFCQLTTEENSRGFHNHPASKALKSVEKGPEGPLQESFTDNTNRLSFMSSGQRTHISSSLSTSPTRESCSTIDDFFPKHSTEDQWMRPNAAAIDGRRRSMQTVSIPALEAHTAGSFRPQSTYGTPSNLSRANSTAPPIPLHFSFPDSSSKHSSCTAKSHPSQPSGTDTLNVPNIVTTAYESADIQSKPLPGVLQQRHKSPSPNEHLPTHEPCLHPPKTTQSKELPGRRSILRSYVSPDDDRLMNFQFPQRCSTLLKATETSGNNPSQPKASTVSLPTPLSESPVTLGPSELPSYIPIHQETSDRLPISFSRKLYRQTSMQVRSSPADLPSRPLLPNTNAQESTKRISSVLPPPLGHSPFLPRQGPFYDHPNIVPPLKVSCPSEENKMVAVRKSMPLLADGPPPAPPPRYALPALPASPNSQPPFSFRNSLQV
jgi:hypothetical protein